MNLRKLKNQAGFTLVELIVVIAIMAILAGVAVPVYSGYIEKAEKAGDLQLLGAVNSAFGAAVIENGSAPQNLTGASATITDGKIAGVSASAENVDLSKVNDSFGRYYAGNETAAFKVIKGLGWDKENGVFVDLATAKGDVTLSYKGSYVTVPAESIQAVQGSTFGEVGSETLMGQVDYVSKLAQAMISGGGVFAGVVYDENFEYISALAGSLNTDAETLYASFNGDQAAMDKFMANSLVLSAAGGTAGMDADIAISKLKNEPNTYIDQIKKDLDDPAKAESALADAALIYGVYTSYVYATDPDNAASKLSAVNGAAGLKQALGAMQTDDFDDYMAGSGADDLEAYLEAMKVVNNAASDPATKMEVLQNGFNDPELIGLMQGIMGK